MNTKPAYIITAVVLIFGAWIFRYDIVATGSGVPEGYAPLAYRLDRWTGNVLMVLPNGTVALKPIPQESPKREGWWSEYPLAN